MAIRPFYRWLGDIAGNQSDEEGFPDSMPVRETPARIADLQAALYSWYIDAIASNVMTGGTAGAYTLALDAFTGFGGGVNGVVVPAVMHATNTAGATFQLGSSAAPIVDFAGAPIAAGVLRQNTRHQFLYSGGNWIHLTPHVIPIDEDYSEATWSADALQATTRRSIETGFDALRAEAATEDRIGRVERATNQEASTGTDTERYVTPAHVKERVDGAVTSLTNSINNLRGDLPPNASETARGIIELATQAEVTAGTDTQRAVTPATIPDVLARNGQWEVIFEDDGSRIWSGTLTLATNLANYDVFLFSGRNVTFIVSAQGLRNGNNERMVYFNSHDDSRSVNVTGSGTTLTLVGHQGAPRLLGAYGLRRDR